MSIASLELGVDLGVDLLDGELVDQPQPQGDLGQLDRVAHDDQLGRVRQVAGAPDAPVVGHRRPDVADERRPDPPV